ncbi:MAG: adenosylcobinamide-GDP ribazoletransferase [Desulfuromonadales bacterium]|nr:adenosylcobinamide-GDP ribazoletransferase [Desulfuromonadales bacterium]
MKGTLGELRQALLFLTVLPLTAAAGSAQQLGRSMAYFPLVGLGLGLLLAGVHQLLLLIFPPAVGALLVLLLLIYATGALHLDGVADTADGMYGIRDRASRLRIMKDSRVGAMGVVALLCLLLLKVVSLTAIPPAVRWQVLIALPVVGRWMMVALAVLAPYARSEGGTGSVFVEGVGRRELMLATLILATVLLGLFQLWGLTLLAALILAVIAIERYFRVRLGGVTGDILGAVCEWSEALFLLLASAAYFHR